MASTPQFKPYFIPEDEWPEFTTALYDNLDSGKENVLELVLSGIKMLFTGGAENRFEQNGFYVIQEEYARLILDQLVALARAESCIMENPEYEERTRFLAIEFVLVLIEDKKGYQILVNTGDFVARFHLDSRVAQLKQKMIMMAELFPRTIVSVMKAYC
ncbi:unnamed protein product [Dovyalis caffra]|uniref:Uncharacterized protein n=1 Tax=Dovyalis caffra TaxID=77055 RepID=A0AAV1SN30_9ROSI|nr:unnamed protein product [Dovyalis caffra]